MSWRTARYGMCCLCLLLSGPGEGQTFFTEVTDHAFLGTLFRARATTFGDFDNDGWPDLFLSQDRSSRPTRIALWHNEGNGRFADRTVVIQGELTPKWKGGGAVFGDYDNDGDLDLFVPVGAYASVDVTRQEWQVVEIPVEPFHLREKPIEALTFSGNFSGTFYLDDIRLVAATPPTVTVVEEERTAALPRSFSLAQNFPNPFNSSTVIRFELPESGEVELAVFNLAGQRVALLAQGYREAGNYTVRWDGRDERGRTLASGVYLYRLRVGKRMEALKLVLVR